jgi:hypothetical protein
MPHINTLCIPMCMTLLASLVSASTSPKRGLCYVPNAKHPSDDQIWVQHGSDLTWYYNYGATPSSSYANLSQSSFAFVPMMWGVNGTNSSDTSFLDAMEDLIGTQGTNITHVLSFNEPNEGTDVGGSDVQPEDAAKAWVANFEPLAEKYGVKLGLPACSGAPSAMPWLEQFLANCSVLVSEGGGGGVKQKNCTWDFLPVHWYDDFAGLASLIGDRVAK